MYYLCGENKYANQLRGYREAELRLCFRICKSLFFHDAAQMQFLYLFPETRSDMNLADTTEGLESRGIVLSNFM